MMFLSVMRGLIQQVQLKQDRPRRRKVPLDMVTQEKLNHFWRRMACPVGWMWKELVG